MAPIHCRVTEYTYDDGRVYVVEGCNPWNDTYVMRASSANWFRITGPTTLGVGDLVRIGHTTLPWTVR